MSEKKDFKYEAQEPVVVNNGCPNGDSEEFIVKDVTFLTPAKIRLETEGFSDFEKLVNIDLVNRKAYVNEGLAPYSDKIFEYLDSANTLPEDIFEAGEDIYNEADKAVSEMEEIRKSALEGE